MNDPAFRVAIRCTVRGCGAPLARGERKWICVHGHSFDVARSGYLNLLQPQDRRSRAPGDSIAATRARRRLAEAGHLEPLLAALRELVSSLALADDAAILDVGAGEGSVLAALSPVVGALVELHGIDLSASAVDLAARLVPRATWIVANADRALPYGDASFALALAVTSRFHPEELDRVLAPGGRVVLAVAGADDLAELRTAMHGKATSKDRRERALSEARGRFTIELQREVRWTATLDRATVDDLLTSSYRGARRAERDRLAAARTSAAGAWASITLHRSITLLERGQGTS